LVLKRRAWRLVAPQAGHARVMAPAAFAAGISSSGDGVCKELAFVSTAGSTVACFALDNSDPSTPRGWEWYRADVCDMNKSCWLRSHLAAERITVGRPERVVVMMAATVFILAWPELLPWYQDRGRLRESGAATSNYRSAVRNHGLRQTAVLPRHEDRRDGGCHSSIPTAAQGGCGKRFAERGDDRGGQPFAKRSRRSRPVTNAHRSKATDENITVDSVAIADHVLRAGFPTVGLRRLACDPFSRWVRGCSQPHTLAVTVSVSASHFAASPPMPQALSEPAETARRTTDDRSC